MVHQITRQNIALSRPLPCFFCTHYVTIKKLKSLILLENQITSKGSYCSQVVSCQFTDRIFDHFTDQALEIRAKEDNLLLLLTLDINPSLRPKFVPSPCPIFST